MERLEAGEVVLGDGGYVFELEKRGYVKAGPYTPEAAAEHPEAGSNTLQQSHAAGLTPHFVYLVYIDYNI